MNGRIVSVILVIAIMSLGLTTGLSLAQDTSYTVEDVGRDNPIDCDFAHYNYCQSEAPLNTSTSFNPVSDPLPNTIVHFAYRGPGFSNYLSWPTSFKASSSGSISGATSLVAYSQLFATGPWDQDFHFDGTYYVAETPGAILAGAGSFGWLFANWLAIDGLAFGQVQNPNINGNTTLYFQHAFLWTPKLVKSATLTLDDGSMFSALIDFREDSIGGHTVTFAPANGYGLQWDTPGGTAPALNTAPNAHNLIMFYAAASSSIVGVPLGISSPLAGSTLIGGTMLSAASCTSATAQIPGAVVGDVVEVTPSDDPNSSASAGEFFWQGIVSSNNVVEVKLCSIQGGEPGSTTYNIRVVQ